MAYQINHYNTTPLGIILDGIIDDTLDIRLIGKNAAGYGEAQNENFVYLLEHFANTSAPQRAIPGQVWFDSTPSVSRLKSYDGANWSQVATLTLENSAIGRKEGDLYWNPAEKKLYIFTNGAFSFVGPQRIPGYAQTELQSTLVKDNSNNDKPVIQAILNGNVVYIISDNDDFTLATNAIAGFNQIKKGITLRDDVKVNGVSTHADYLVDKVPDDFIYSANPQFAVLATFDDVGFNVGTELSVFNDGTIPTIQSNGPEIRFKSGSDTSLKLTNADILPGTQSVSNIGSLTYKWNNVYANYVYSTSEKADSVKFNQDYILTSEAGDAPRSIVVRDAASNINAVTFTGSLIGNAASATKLQTARTINGVVFDGTSAITVTALTPNTLTPGTDIIGLAFNGSASRTWSIDATDQNTINKIVKRDASGNFRANQVIANLKGNVISSNSGNTVINTSDATAVFTGNLTGNADTATKLQTGRTINGVLFDGSNSIVVADSTKVAKTGDTMTGFLTLHSNPTNNLHAATKQYVDTYGCPTGVIVMWSGSVGSIPTGWALCNGQTVNNRTTPNLTDRFILGAGNSYAPGNTGGATSNTTNSQGTHNHGGTGSTSLSVAQVPSHQHNFTDVYAIVGDYELGSSTASTRDRNGNYIYPSFYAGNASDGDYDNGAYGFPSITEATGSGQGHSHSVNSDGAHSHTVSTVPPYYALAYIMKVV